MPMDMDTFHCPNEMQICLWASSEFFTVGLKEFKGRNFQINGTGSSESAKSINKTAESFNILIYFKFVKGILTVS